MTRVLDSRASVALLLVGGRGTRLGPVTSELPKPLLPVGGRPFLDWVMQPLLDAGVHRFILAAGHLASAVEDFASARLKDGLELTVLKEPIPLGTGGAILSALRSGPEGDPIVIANGDSLLAGDISCVTSPLEADVDGLIVGTELEGENRFGRLAVDATGCLTAIHEKSGTDGLLNAGIYVFRRRALASLGSEGPLSFEREGIPVLLQKGFLIKVVAISAPFIDIGVPASLAAADAFVQRHMSAAALRR